MSLFPPENTFEVKLFKNSSGLGFSFSREDNLIPEQMNASIVRVKKLFPGQPAAESGQIAVGDVILKVNGASLKGLSQQVSASPGEHARFLWWGDWLVWDWFHCAFFCHSWFPRKSYLLSGEQLQKYPCFSVDLHLVCFQKLTLLFWWDLCTLYFYDVSV